MSQPEHPPAPRPKKAATLADVARLAGVSPMTASRVINTPERVNAALAARVRSAVDLLGYVPNALAAGLRASKARMVAALLPTLIGPVFQELVTSLSNAFAAQGYQLMIGQIGYGPVEDIAAIRSVIQRRPDGIVMVGLCRSQDGFRMLRASGIPVVETWDLSANPVDMLVGFSHTQIGRAVAETLFRKGFRDVGIITAADPRAQAREKAFIERSNELGAHSARAVYTVAPSTVGSGRKGLADLLNAPLSGVFCSSDSLALGAAIEAQSRGLRVPGELGIVGMGDQSFARDAEPPLTTVRLDGTRIGRLAADMIFARAQGRAVESPIVDLGFEIVERSST